MTEQGQSTRVSRRTIAKGAAWAVPVVPLVVATPAYAQTECAPLFTATGNSAKCCAGQVKNMKLEIEITDPNGCVPTGQEICIVDVVPKTGGTVQETIFVPGPCVTDAGTVTVYLQDVSDCTVNLLVHYSVGGGPTLETPLKSDNIPSGNANGEVCVPPAA